MTPGFGTLSEECFILRDPETANGSNMEVAKAQLVLLLGAFYFILFSCSQADLHYSSSDQTAAFGQSKHGKS